MRVAMPFGGVLLLCSASITCAGTMSPDLPPAEAVANALDNHPLVAAAGARVTAAKAQGVALRKGPSEVTVSGSYLRRDVPIEGVLDEFEVNVSRPFRLPAKARLDRQAGQLGVAVAQNRMEDVRHQTSLELSRLWFDWLTAGALLANDRDAVANLTRARDAVRRRVQLRDAAALDVDQAESALALAQGQAADSEARLAEARAILTATFPEIPMPAEPPALHNPDLPQDGVETLGQWVVERSHEIGAAQNEADRMSVVADRVRVDRVADPSFGLRSFSERSGEEKGLGVVFSMPLGGGYRRAAADQAAAQSNAALLELSNVRRGVQAIANADMSNARTRFVAWQSMQTSATRAAEAADRTARGYALGAIDLSDLLYAQRQANDARRSEIASRSDARRALMKLEIDSHVIWAPAEGEAE